MSYPRGRLDLNLLILEKKACEAMVYASRKKDPTWKFSTFEAIHFGALKPDEIEERYSISQVLGLAERYFEELDKRIPFCLPMEEGTHYLWELFAEIPKVGESASTRQFWNRLARALSDRELPMTVDEFVAAYSEAAQKLLSKATDMGDRFYLSELDFGGWSGGIVSKDFLVEGMDKIARKLDGPLLAVQKKEKAEEPSDESCDTSDTHGSEGEETSLKDTEERKQKGEEESVVLAAFSKEYVTKRKRFRKNPSRQLWLQVQKDSLGNDGR